MKRTMFTALFAMFIVCYVTSVCVGDLVTIVYPGQYRTEARGISENYIVGEYRIGEAGDYHGFIYDGTTYSTLDYPGASATLAYGISGNNTVGVYEESGHIYGFLYDGMSYSNLSYPLPANTKIFYNSTAYADNTLYLSLMYPSNTTLTGISGDNIIGLYLSGYWHSFVYDGTDFRNIDVLEAEGTKAWGIFGDIVVGMCYQDYDTEFTYGFLYDISTSTYKYYSVPNKQWTALYGIYNDSVVGSYFDGVNMYGFKANISDFSDTIPNVVPIPSAVLLGAIGLAVSGWRLRRKNS